MLNKPMREYLAFRVLLIDPAKRSVLRAGLANMEATEPLETICLSPESAMTLQHWIRGNFTLDKGDGENFAVNCHSPSLTFEPLSELEPGQRPRFLIWRDLLFISDDGPEVPPEHLAQFRLNAEQQITLPKRTAILGIHRQMAVVKPRPTIVELARSLSSTEMDLCPDSIRWSEGNLDMPIVQTFTGSLINHFVHEVEGNNNDLFDTFLKGDK